MAGKDNPSDVINGDVPADIGPAVQARPDPAQQGEVMLPRATREDILNAMLGTEVLNVPEWGRSVEIRPLTLRGRTEIFGSIGADAEADMTVEQVEQLTVLTFINCVVDPPFTKDDYESLAVQNAGAMDRVTQHVMKASGIDTEALANAEKN